MEPTTTTAHDYFTAFIGVLGLELPLGVILNFACILYIVFKLNLNGTIKKILLADCCYSLACLIITLIGYIFVSSMEIRSPVSCVLFLYPITIAFVSSSVLTSVLSYVRFKMASRASEGSIYDNRRLKSILYMGLFSLTIYHVGMMLAGIFFDSFPAKGVVLCIADGTMNSDIRSAVNNMGFMNLVLIVVSLVIGLYYDVAMVKFIRQRAQVQPVRLAVWSEATRRSSARTEETLSYAVPVKSTILNSVAIGFIVIASFLLAVIDPQDKIGLNQLISTMSVTRACIHMILVLTFIVKSQDRKERSTVRALPPRSLQFHDNNEASTLHI